MNITRSTRKSKFRNLAKLAAVRKRLTLTIVSILSCMSLLLVGGVASSVDLSMEIDNPITYTSDIAFERSPEGVEFYIKTYQDLQALSSLVATNATITGTDIAYASATYILMKDITNSSGDELNPIGTSESPFSGVFNGNGHLLRDIKISGTSYVGLFGATNGATITGVNIKSGTISGAGDYVGAIVGKAEDTEISKCSNAVEITGGDYVGGLAGDITNSNIYESANLAKVTGSENVGGLVGSVSNTVVATELIDENQVNIAHCFNSGNVSGATVVGGLAGTTNGTSEYARVLITGCYSVAKLTGTRMLGSISGVYSHTYFVSSYALENMGGTPSGATVSKSGENMSGDDALASTKLSGFDSSYWEAVANDDSAYNLPKIKALGIGAVLYKITYELYGGILPADKSTYTEYFKASDDIILPTPTKEDHIFLEWSDSDNDTVTAESVKQHGGNITIYAVWDVIDDPIESTRHTLTIRNDQYQTSSEPDVTLTLIDGDGNVVNQTGNGRTASLTHVGSSIVEGETGGEFEFLYNPSATYTLKISVSDGNEYGLWITLDGQEKAQAQGSELTWEGWSPTANNTWTWSLRELYTVTAERDVGVANAAFTYKYFSTQGPVESSSTVYHGSEVTFVAQPDVGYTFEGWYNADGEMVSSDAEYSPFQKDSNPLVSDYTLTAKAEPISYTIVFDPNTKDADGKRLLAINEDGTITEGALPSGEMDSVLLYWESSCDLEANAYTIEGYTFLGWSTDEDASEPEYEDMGRVTNLTSKANGEVILFAVWSRNSYTITFNYNIPGATNSPIATLTGKFGQLIDAPGVLLNESIGAISSISDLLSGTNLQTHKFLWWTSEQPSATNNNLISEVYDFLPTYATLNNTVDPLLQCFNGDKTVYAEWYKLLSSPDTYSREFSEMYNTNYEIVQSVYDLIYLTSSANSNQNGLYQRSIGIVAGQSYDINQVYTYFAGTISNETFTFGANSFQMRYTTISTATQSNFVGVDIIKNGRYLQGAGRSETQAQATIILDGNYVNTESAGMFKSFATGVIAYITLDLENCGIIDSAATYMGGLVGIATNVSLHYVKVRNANLSTSTSGKRVGGVIGYYNLTSENYGLNYVGSNTVDIVSDGGYAGGVVGYVNESLGYSLGHTLCDIKTISITMGETATPYAGGVFGYIDGSFARVNITKVNNVIITSASTTTACLGGIAGMAYEVNFNITSISRIKINSVAETNNTANTAGGVVGMAASIVTINGTYADDHNLFDIEDFANALYAHSSDARYGNTGRLVRLAGGGSYAKASRQLTMAVTTSNEIIMGCGDSANYNYLIPVKAGVEYTLSWAQSDTSSGLGAKTYPIIYNWSSTNTSTGSTSLTKTLVDSDEGRYKSTFTATGNFISIGFAIQGATNPGGTTAISFSKVRLVNGTNATWVSEPSANLTTVNITSSGPNVGGVAGYLTSSSTIKNMVVKRSKLQGAHEVGGIVGASDSNVGSYTNVEAQIKNGYGSAGAISYCMVYNSTITATSDTDANAKRTTNAAGTTCSMYTVSMSCAFVGGIVGYMHDGLLVGCESVENTITAESGAIGGIVGGALNVSSIAYCYNNSDVVATGTTSATKAVGGIVGFWVSYKSSINNDYSGVTCSSNFGEVSGFMSVGGIIGFVYGTITEYSDDSSILYHSLVTSCVNHGPISSKHSSGYVGGLIGYVYYISGAAYSIQYSNNLGTVSGSSTYTGGLFGNLYYGGDSTPLYFYISQCINMGQLTNGISGGAISGSRSSDVNHASLINVYYYSLCGGSDDGSEVGLDASLGYTLMGSPYNFYNRMKGFNYDSSLGLASRKFYSPRIIMANGDKHALFEIENEYLFDVFSIGADKATFWIKTNDDIDNLRHVITENEKMPNGKYYNDQIYYYYAPAGLTITEPLSTKEMPFSGTFKGVNESGTATMNTITLDMDITGSGVKYAGLFGGLDGANVSYIKTRGTLSGGWECVGSIAGHAVDSSITNCEAGVTVESVAANHLGGIIGDALSTTIQGCQNTGSVTNKHAGTPQSSVGGIVGQIDLSTISNCENTGAILGYYHVGGCIGMSQDGQIQATNNSGSVSGNDYVGGIVGGLYSGSMLQGTSSQSYGINSGNVSGYYCIGGIAGRVSSEDGPNVIAIKNYNNSGTVTCLGYWWEHDVDNFSFDGDKSIIKAFALEVNIGGIVGVLDSAKVESVTSSGSVILQEKSDIPDFQVEHGGLGWWQADIKVKQTLCNFGGLVGLMTNAKLSNARISANITVGMTTVSATEGIISVGGLVGQMDSQSYIGTDGDALALGDSINVSTTGTITIHGSYFVGGVVGYVSDDGANHYNIIASVKVSINVKNPTQGYYTFNNDIIPFETIKVIGCHTECYYYVVEVEDNGSTYTYTKTS